MTWLAGILSDNLTITEEIVLGLVVAGSAVAYPVYRVWAWLKGGKP